MANSFVPGYVVVHQSPATLGGALAADPQVMGASESAGAFAARVNEMAGLVIAMIASRDPTAFTAMRTRADAIDD